ncbi:serine/arginine-rich splicing factor SC35-like [Magnolia sinica]|uniref:serine/arginine-rich splicing factor SC35-like n=1 Tax=Magnolia sinica TaxID=86752 RepID=UPI0026597DB2|nr:serine/arginine-rich splicing factor SC35-like [Magnolia sinica]
MEERERKSQWERVSPRKSRSSISKFSVFAANLTFDTTLDDLHRIFGRFGKLADVFILWNRTLNQSRGFAFIRFCYEQDALNVIYYLHERRIDGRVVHINWARKKSRMNEASHPPSVHIDWVRKRSGMKEAEASHPPSQN